MIREGPALIRGRPPARIDCRLHRRPPPEAAPAIEAAYLN